MENICRVCCLPLPSAPSLSDQCLAKSPTCLLFFLLLVLLWFHFFTLSLWPALRLSVLCPFFHTPPKKSERPLQSTSVKFSGQMKPKHLASVLTPLLAQWAKSHLESGVLRQWENWLKVLLTPVVSPVDWLVIQQSPRECRMSDPRSPGREEGRKEGKKEVVKGERREGEQVGADF